MLERGNKKTIRDQNDTVGSNNRNNKATPSDFRRKLISTRKPTLDTLSVSKKFLNWGFAGH